MPGTEDNQVGILGIEVYFPSTYVSQSQLEVANGVSAGKYTVGLGQENMAFTGDLEDVNSIALTAVQSLMEKYGINPSEVGRLEVGTESLVDKSKSTKTVLMSLFAESGNTDIEGATVVNACYGGTAALLNALSWLDSSAWDGRFAIVVAADVAVYAEGPARPTGGCGAVALLLGRHAPLQIDLRTRVAHATHVWDFFKPKLDSEYPEVNGALSQTCYLRALDDCYTRFVQKSQQQRGRDVTVSGTDHFLFHAPYNKLVQKSFARLVFQDMLAGREAQLQQQGADCSALAAWRSADAADTYEDKALEAALKGVAAHCYQQKVAAACEMSRQIGNTYTASVYMNLAMLVSTFGAALQGKNLVLFSYGSGALASMFSVIPHSNSSNNNSNNRFSLEKMQQALNIDERLKARELLHPDDLTTALSARENSHGYVPFTPTCSIEKLAAGTFYLLNINASYERIYARKPLDAQQVRGGALIATAATATEEEADMDDVGVDIDDFDSSLRLSSTQTSSLQQLAGSNSNSSVNNNNNSSNSGSGMSQDSFQRIRRSETKVFASGRQNVKVVVTGIAAALPGRDHDVFPIGVNNVRRIIDGESFISNIPSAVMDAMLEKNLTVASRNSDGSSTTTSIDRYDQTINVCASIGRISLTDKYGISESLAATMDRAVQVAIAAGLEALLDAGLVTGTGPDAWVLPEHFQSTTGVVYATSFPALDTAIAEVSRYFKSQTVSEMNVTQIISALRKKLTAAGDTNGSIPNGSIPNGSPLGTVSEAAESALKQLEEVLIEMASQKGVEEQKASSSPYQFDRKFLFRVLVLGNAQLAQIVKARGPNMQTNAACAGATQAIALAYDMIQVGRAERVIIIAGDSASSDNLMPWLGNGFRILGAACISADAATAARPFSASRSGMILGSGGIGMILESEDGARRRHLQKLAATNKPADAAPSAAARSAFRCRLLGTLVSNSAFHGAAMDKVHIAQEMERFIAAAEKQLGINRRQIAQQGVYFSHETSTHASPSSSCAANEIYGLRQVFGEHLKDLLILNTKGFTGHPMGVSFEDVVAAEVLCTGRVPPIANYSGVDPYLGSDLKLSTGGLYPCKYAIRFAAGFGSQIALALYGTADTD